MNSIKQRIFNNPLTTVAGIIVIFSGFVSTYPDRFGGKDSIFVDVCEYTTTILGGSLGILGKDGEFKKP